MAKRRYYDQMRQIVDCVVKIGMGNDNVIDEIVGACLLVIADNPSEVYIYSRNTLPSTLFTILPIKHYSKL